MANVKPSGGMKVTGYPTTETIKDTNKAVTSVSGACANVQKNSLMHSTGPCCGEGSGRNEEIKR